MLLRRTLPIVALLALAAALGGPVLLGQGGGGRGGRGTGPIGGVGGPSRDAADQRPAGTGILAGVVLAQGTGSPVRRARVSLTGPELRGGRTTSTDDNGRFIFLALPAGRFSLNVSRAGFVDIAYGARRPGRQGTPIQLTDGQRLDNLSISMPRGSVITGIVVDEHGEPAPGIQVRVFRYVLRTGERTLVQAGQDQTDDRGMYRIYQLQPGDYLVSAVPRNVSGNTDLRQAIAAELANLSVAASRDGGPGDNPFVVSFALADGPVVNAALQERATLLQQQLAAIEDGPTAYAPVYYPGTTSSASALPVTVDAGQERGGIDFRLQLVPTTELGGIVSSPGGALPQGTQVALVPNPQRGGGPVVPGLGRAMTRVGPDGRFRFNSVTPGEYLLQARAFVRDPAAVPGRGRGGMNSVAQVLWASAEVSVGGQALPDIVLDLRTGMTVSGRVTFEGAGQTAVNPASVRLALTPQGGQTFEMGATASMTQADNSGRFIINGVAPGRYTLTASIMTGGRGNQAASAATSGWTLRSATFNGQDLLDFPIDIGPDQNLSDVVVTYTDRTQELTGTIQDTSGGPTSDFTIIVFPSDERYRVPMSRRVMATRPATDGRFAFRGLPAGSYRLTAVTDVEPGEWYDPAFLTRMESASIPILLAEGERKVQDIRLAGY